VPSDVKILYNYKKPEKGSYLLKEGSLIKVSRHESQKWHKMIYKEGNVRVKGYIKTGDFEFIKRNKTAGKEALLNDHKFPLFFSVFKSRNVVA